MVASLKPLHMIALAAVGGALIYVLRTGANAGQVGADLAGAGVDLVAGAFVGGVESIGEQVGIPRTNQTECERAIAEGRTWDASFACPAGTFIKSLFN